MTLAEILDAAPAMTLAALADAVARWRIRAALDATKGDVRAATGPLGMTERTLHREIARLGLRDHTRGATYDRPTR